MKNKKKLLHVKYFFYLFIFYILLNYLKVMQQKDSEKNVSFFSEFKKWMKEGCDKDDTFCKNVDMFKQLTWLKGEIQAERTRDFPLYLACTKYWLFPELVSSSTVYAPFMIRFFLEWSIVQNGLNFI